MVDRKFYGFALFLTALILSFLGVLFIYTGSYFWCLRKGIPPYSYALKQTVALVVSVFGAFLLYRFFDYRDFVNQKILRFIYTINIIILTSVLIFGKEIHNSKSWIVIGKLSLQPAEFSKVLTIVFFSAYLRYKWYDIKSNFTVFLSFITFAFFIPVLLILAEGDLGSAMILSISLFSILLVTGLNPKYTLAPLLLGTFLFITAVLVAPYRLMRIKILFHPEAYFHTVGKYSSYQLVQALVSFAKGGLTGMGLGQGVQAKFQFLTYAYSDFIFAHIAEEAGALGCAAVILLFLAFLYCGLSIADRTDEQVGKYLAIGLTSFIFLQAMVHIGVNLGLLPTTGITLPFISAGGSSLLSSFLAVGILMSIAKNLPRESKIKAKVVSRGRYAL